MSPPSPRWAMPFLVGLLAARAAPVSAQDWLFLDGIADAEFWGTDTGSPFLTRDDGHPALAGQLQLFAGAAIGSSFQLLSLSELEGGPGSEEGDIELSVDQAVLRYIRSPALVVEVGKFATPIGTFPARRFSTRNPLIGAPDGFPVSYPWGLEIGGVRSRLDYRVALVSLPWTHADYVPDPGFALRPVVGVGVTPMVGFRLGASFSEGPYLSPDIRRDLAAGVDWHDFDQRVLAVDGRFSRGYLESYAELAFTTFDVPGAAGRLAARSWYVEVKYTWAPRLYTAFRVEENRFASIQPVANAPWVGETLDLLDGELGLGYRVGTHTLAKASYRRDHWKVPVALRAQYRTGNAVALQFSQEVDIVSLLRGKVSGN